MSGETIIVSVDDEESHDILVVDGEQPAYGFTPENPAHKDASGGYAGLTGFKLNLLNAVGNVTSWLTNAATGVRTWTFPDKSGTVAMTSDVITSHTGLSSIGTNTHAQIDTALARLAATSGANTGDQDLSAYALTAAVIPLSALDNDGTMAANSASRVPSQQAARTYVASQIAALVASSPASLDTLKELADALGDDPNFATTMATALGNRLRVDTAAQGLSGTQQTNARTNLGLGSAALASTTDGVTEGGTNLYFTGARVLATLLTGLSTATNAVVLATDTVLVGIGKLQKQITDFIAQKAAASGLASLDANSKVVLAQTRRLLRTTVKTANYAAAAYDLVPVDTTAGNVTVTLPTAPEDAARVCVKHIIQGGTNTIGIACGGADVINRTGGATSTTLRLLAEAVVLEYDAATAIWTVVADDVPVAQLDARYAFKGAYVAVADGVTITPALITSDTTRVDQTNTQAAGTLTLANPTGTPVDGEILVTRATCTNAQTLAFGTSYRGTNQLSLPSATTGGGKTDRMVWEYKSAAAKWDLIGISFGA